ncbi:MAG: ligase protein, partial [Parcubacteria group bacterium GW2011_GWE2_43_12]
TGTLTNLTRQQVGEIIRQQGGSTSESVSAQTDYVVAGENPGSKMTKAKKLGVKVLSEDDFNKLVNK